MLYLSALAGVLISSLLMLQQGMTKENEPFSEYVDGDGRITRPVGIREDWTFLGAWTLPDKKDDGMHIVYTQPGVAEEFRKNGGKFPDGAVIVKEVRSIRSEPMTTGPDVIHATDEALWFVMIKNDKGRFPGNPNWGEGWGWALFKADRPSVNVSSDYKTDCLGCHIPAKPTDWIYTRGYPVLENGN